MTKKRKAPSEAPGDRRLGPLIDRLGPINNACRQAEGIDKVEHLWDLGEALLQFDPDANDELLWAVADRSYMTRDLLRYALIIRRGWSDRADLRRTFPRLAHYSLFREALPFLKGDRCDIGEETYKEIVGRLNGRNGQQTKEFLGALKAAKIGRKHKKGQAVAKMSQVAESVRTSIRQLFDLAADLPKVVAARDAIKPEAILVLSQWCMAVAEDNTVPAASLESDAWPEPFATLASALLLVSRAGREDRAGFRKALGPMTLMEAADLINAMRSDERLEQWKRRRRMDLTI